MKFSVDEIIDGVAKLENLDTREIIYLDTYLLPNNIKENDILVKIDDNNYEVSVSETENRVKTIEEKMRALRGE